jgi:hypothetical protein
MTFARTPQPTRSEKLESRSLRMAAMAQSVRATERSSAVCGGEVGGAVAKERPIRSSAIRKSAEGAECTVRLPGCPSDPTMTIWSHYRGGAGGKGGAIKATDIAGAFACTYCDAVYDGQRPRPDGMTKDAVDLAWLEGHIRSLVILRQKNLLGEMPKGEMS